jgi:predicted DNA-binding transcriptional regulator AlpA
MSNKKIKAIWLSLERVAELKGCTQRTVWRYINASQIQTYKHLIKVGQRKVYKTFVLTDPEVAAVGAVCLRDSESGAG